MQCMLYARRHTEMGGAYLLCLPRGSSARTPATTIYVTRGSTSSSVYSRITNIDVLCVLTIQTILLHLLDTKPYLEGRDFTQNFPVEEKRRRGRRATTSHE
ncbi:hypothetical protein B9Z55_019827 [Caenorhabditis nigoni]|uniref:Uncharacterized protein n=1 Tax=Caenorhabditis nigoni TaxID=1611254 RepID=A0A2G5TK16_9PELO|nr:hypothetical protein B9Z55_019827 [Caenorhabditis nigoni]